MNEAKKLSGTAKVLENISIFGLKMKKSMCFDPSKVIKGAAYKVKKPGKYVSRKQRELSLVKKMPKAFPFWLPDVIKADRGMKFS